MTEAEIMAWLSMSSLRRSTGKILIAEQDLLEAKQYERRRLRSSDMWVGIRRSLDPIDSQTFCRAREYES